MSSITLFSVLALPPKKHWKLRSLQENLTLCYDQKLYVDAEIRIQGKIFKAHKNILSFYSPTFQKAFYNPKNPSSLFVMNSITPEGFTILLRFLYCSQIPVPVNPEDLIEACFAAKELEMGGIKEKLVNYILCKTTPGKPIVGENFWSFLKKSRLLKFKEIEEKLLEFAENHFALILFGKDFAKADSEIIKLVFNKKPPYARDEDILERIGQWKDSNRDLKLLDVSVRELLVYVNFEKLSPKEFYTIVAKHNDLIPAKDSLDILMHLVDPTACSLPQWCHTDDKVFNIPANLQLNPETGISSDWYKTDKFKSLDDLRPVNDLNSSRECASLKKDFQSQGDLRVISSVEDRRRRKSNIGDKSFRKTLPESFYQMLEEGMFTDVTLVAKDGTKIPAHRLVLALGSEVFANILYKTTASNKVHFEETADELKIMLRYFYEAGERISLKTVRSSLDSVLRKTDLALKYECYPLLQACRTSFFPVRIDPCMFWRLLEQADLLVKCKVNTPVLMKYAMTSTKDLFDHESFYRASKDSLVKVLKSDYLNMAEWDILEYGAKWLETNANNSPTDHYKMELFKKIRFEALNAEQFFEFLQRHDKILSKEDSFAILTFLFRKSSENRLPGWCYCGPLRSIFYDASTKIGTTIPVGWKDFPEKKDKQELKCTYTVAISKNWSCQVQYLELSLKVKLPKARTCNDCKCSIIIKPDDGSKLLSFDDLRVVPQQRYLLPVSFSLNSQKPKLNFDIIVHAKHSHRFYYMKNRRMDFNNVVFESKRAKNCLSDVIVDNLTSQQVRIPEYLLPANNYAAIPTEKMFKIISENASLI